MKQLVGRRASYAWIVVAFALMSRFVYGAEPAATEASPRAGKQVSLSLTAGTEPFPSILGFTAGIRLVDSLRLQLSTGAFFLGETYGGGLTYIVSPENSWSAIAGISIARSRIHDIFGGLFGGTPRPDEIVWTSAMKLGVDYQAMSGFRFSAGWGWAWLVEPATAYDLRAFPSVEIGWAF